MSSEHRNGNADLLERFWNLFRGKDVAALQSLFTADTVWYPPLYFVRYESYGPFHGAREVATTLITAGEKSYDKANLKIERTALIANETDGAITFSLDGHTSTGRPYSNGYLLTFRFRDGLIAEGREHMDTAVWMREVRGALS